MVNCVINQEKINLGKKGGNSFTLVCVLHIYLFFILEVRF